MSIATLVPMKMIAMTITALEIIVSWPRDNWSKRAQNHFLFIYLFLYFICSDKSKVYTRITVHDKQLMCLRITLLMWPRASWTHVIYTPPGLLISSPDITCSVTIPWWVKPCHNHHNLHTILCLHGKLIHDHNFLSIIL